MPRQVSMVLSFLLYVSNVYMYILTEMQYTLSEKVLEVWYLKRLSYSRCVSPYRQGRAHLCWHIVDLSALPSFVFTALHLNNIKYGFENLSNDFKLYIFSERTHLYSCPNYRYPVVVLLQ